MSAATSTVTVLTARAIIGAAAHRGVALDDVLALHAVDQALLADDDARVPQAAVIALWGASPSISSIARAASGPSSSASATR